MFLFLIFGTIILRVFGTPLSMVRVVGWHHSCAAWLHVIILVLWRRDDGSGWERSGRERRRRSLYSAGHAHYVRSRRNRDDPWYDIPREAVGVRGRGVRGVAAAIVATMAVTYPVLRAARMVLARIVPEGSAPLRIVGFFVSAKGMGWSFTGR